MAAKAKTTAIVEKKLVSVADVVIQAAERSRDPALNIPIRSLANVSFNEKHGIIEMGRKKQERTFFNVGMAKKFMQTVLVADALVELQRSDLTTSLREIYYRSKHTMKGSHENTFDAQNESDPLIEDLEVTLEALREELHVRAENRGSIVGPLVLTDDGDRVDCARLGKGGYSVPSIVEPDFIQIRRCTADFVLLNDTIVSGYGFTAEPDYLYAIDRATGKVQGRLLLPSAPQTIARHGNILTVVTYDHRLTVRMGGA